VAAQLLVGFHNFGLYFRHIFGEGKAYLNLIIKLVEASGL
jgi:hypothetical protein